MTDEITYTHSVRLPDPVGVHLARMAMKIGYYEGVMRSLGVSVRRGTSAYRRLSSLLRRPSRGARRHARMVKAEERRRG